MVNPLAADGAGLLHELVGALWDRPLTPFYYRFAIFEVMAHLEYMGRLHEVVSAV